MTLHVLHPQPHIFNLSLSLHTHRSFLLSQSQFVHNMENPFEHLSPSLPHPLLSGRVSNLRTICHYARASRIKSWDKSHDTELGESHIKYWNNTMLCLVSHVSNPGTIRHCGRRVTYQFLGQYNTMLQIHVSNHGTI